MAEKELISSFIKRHSHGVIATVNQKGNPEAAFIEYAETDGPILIFDTSRSFRKFSNIQANERVAFVIGDEKEQTGIQIEGAAKEVIGSELQRFKEIYFAKSPDAKKWEHDPDTVYFRLTPSWIRYRSYATAPMTLFEVNF